MSLKKLGRYDLIRVLGKGAMGLVYEGRDPNLDRRVAIKTIKVENLSDEAAADYEVRFRTEARSAARLQHPNIVSVYDSDRDIDIAYLVMEFIQGDDLKHHLDNGTLYTLEQTLGIMTDLLSALDYAHRQNIVHRDIKPANLLIEADGRVKLTDFGVARIQDSGDLTRTQGSIVGTLKYMSPEQVQGRPVDARADLFAAGIVLYQLLTGRRPFDGGSDFATIQQIVNHTPDAPTSFNDRLPPALDAVIARALAKSRDQRYPSAQEFSKALKDAARDASDPTIVPTLRGAAYGPNATWTGTVHADEALSGLQSSLMGGAAASTVTQELELVYWKDIKDSIDAEDLQLFINKFPSGIYADLARRRLKKLGVLAGDESDSGSRSGTSTQIFVQGDGGRAGDATVLLARDAGANTRTGHDAADAAELVPEAAPGPAVWPEMPGVAADGAAAPKPGKTGASRRRVTALLAGMLGLVLLAVLLKWMTAPDPSQDTQAAVGQPAVSAAGQSASPENAASANIAAAVPPSSASTPGPAGTEASAPAAPLPAASKPALAASARKARAEKAALDKAARAEAGGPDGGTARSAAAGAATAKPVDAPSRGGGPEATCEGRVLFGLQMCLAQECAKPAFANHAVCVKRRAQEQQRRDEEMLRR